jgi:hypothetical protein
MERAKFRFVLFMDDSYFEHPAEELLERYLLRQTNQAEAEVLESHVLACESCVTRLENLETDIAAMKSALTELQQQERAAETAKARGWWRNWFTMPALSWAGAVAAIVVGIAVIPSMVSHNRPVDVSLSAYRGIETVVVPENRPLHLNLNANDIPDGRVRVSVTDSTGAEIWSGLTQIHNGSISVTVPRIGQAGAHYVRLYPAAPGSSDLLREFSLDVK